VLAEERALSELSEKNRSLSFLLDDDDLRLCGGNTARYQNLKANWWKEGTHIPTYFSGSELQLNHPRPMVLACKRVFRPILVASTLQRDFYCFFPREIVLEDKVASVNLADRGGF